MRPFPEWDWSDRVLMRAMHELPSVGLIDFDEAAFHATAAALAARAPVAPLIPPSALQEAMRRYGPPLDATDSLRKDQ